MSTRVSKGDHIEGHRIYGRALKILPINRSADLQKTTLERGAYCVVEVPLKITNPASPKKSSTEYDPPVLEAHKIHGQACYITDPELFRRSGAHRGSSIVLKGSALCIVDIPMRWVGERKE